MTIVNITDRELELERLLKQSEHTATIAYMSGFYDGKKKREWVGLTDEELMDMMGYGKQYGYIPQYARNFVDAIEAKLKEKNHG